MRAISIYFFGICLGWLLASCEICGIGNFYSATTSEKQFFTKLRVLGALKDSVAFGFSSAQLPINLNANSTTYIFKHSGKNDTLTVFYEKNDASSPKCGYVLDLEAPKRGPYYKSSFKNVSVSYAPAYQLYPPHAYGAPNVYVTISLHAGLCQYSRTNPYLRIVRNLRSVYVQVLREQQNQSRFWNYGGFVNLTSGDGYIDVRGNFFDDYRAAIPNFVGSAVGIKTQPGFVTKIATKWRLRSFGHVSVNYSGIGSPNARNIADGGFAPFFVSGLSPTYGLSFQLFYLPKAV